MSTDISPRSSTPTSTSGHLKQGQSLASVAPASPEDPALIVGLVLIFARQRQGGLEIPSLLLARLHGMARSGDPTCRLVLNYVGSKVRRGRPAVSHYDAPPEIVSADPATKEG